MTSSVKNRRSAKCIARLQCPVPIPGGSRQWWALCDRIELRGTIVCGVIEWRGFHTVGNIVLCVTHWTVLKGLPVQVSSAIHCHMNPKKKPHSKISMDVLEIVNICCQPHYLKLMHSEISQHPSLCPPLTQGGNPKQLQEDKGIAGSVLKLARCSTDSKHWLCTLHHRSPWNLYYLWCLRPLFPPFFPSCPSQMPVIKSCAWANKHRDCYKETHCDPLWQS